MKTSKLRLGFTASSVILIFLYFLVAEASEDHYVKQFLESVEVCMTSSATSPFNFKKTIRLANFPNNTVSLRLTRWNRYWRSFLPYQCKLQVASPKNHGVMAVIQSLNLRKGKEDPTICRDFIKFEEGDGLRTKNICGSVQQFDLSSKPEGLIGERQFYTYKGKIDVTFITDEKDNKLEEEDPVHIDVVFTAFKECPRMGLFAYDQLQCSKFRENSCIPKSLKCDGVINCAFRENFAFDEMDCEEQLKPESRDEKYLSATWIFAITAISSLVFASLFILMVCILPRLFARTAVENPDVTNPIEFDVVHSRTPPQDQQKSQDSTLEKRKEDMPPSYDALFPVKDVKKK